MEVSLIILTYNSGKYIDDLLQGLIEKYKEEIQEKKLEILVADNNSQDETLKLLKKYKEVRVVENGENLGFAKGNNVVVEQAKGNTLVFLNPDTKVVGGDIFEMVSEFEDPLVGIVGGKIKNYKGSRELSCGKVYTWWSVLLLSLGLEEFVGVRFAPEKRREVDYVSGAFLAINHFLFEQLNGFDEHYFMYIEDADLCFRVKKDGFKVVFSPLATIQHMGQGSSNRTFAVVQIYKGLLYFQKKHMSKASYMFSRFLLQSKAHLLVILGKLSHNQYLVSTYEEALKAT